MITDTSGNPVAIYNDAPTGSQLPSDSWESGSVGDNNILKWGAAYEQQSDFTGYSYGGGGYTNTSNGINNQQNPACSILSPFHCMSIAIGLGGTLHLVNPAVPCNPFNPELQRRGGHFSRRLGA